MLSIANLHLALYYNIDNLNIGLHFNIFYRLHIYKVLDLINNFNILRKFIILKRLYQNLGNSNSELRFIFQ